MRALALVEHVVDGRRDRGHAQRDLALRRRRLEAVRELLGDEAGRQLARLPARMLHQGRQERDVVADAVDGEGVERRACASIACSAGRRMGHELGDHRVVIDRDLAALVDAGVVAHGHAVGSPSCGGR